jgi:heme-degrading monooxygenase HmoA
MIARIWHGHTSPADADAYEATLRAEILPGIKEVRGYLGCYILRRQSGNEVEFVTILLWESLGALQAFAGPDYERAIVPAERRRFLSHYDERSAHYEVVVQPTCEPV